MSKCLSCDNDSTHTILSNSFYLNPEPYCCECFGQCYDEQHPKINHWNIR